MSRSRGARFSRFSTTSAGLQFAHETLTYTACAERGKLNFVVRPKQTIAGSTGEIVAMGAGCGPLPLQVTLRSTAPKPRRN